MGSISGPFLVVVSGEECPPVNEEKSEPVYLTPDDVVRLVPGSSKASLAQRRYQGKPPKFLKSTARLVRYREKDVRGWIEESEQTMTDSYRDSDDN